MVSSTAHSGIEERIARLEQTARAVDARLQRLEAGPAPAMTRKAVTTYPPGESRLRVEPPLEPPPPAPPKLPRPSLGAGMSLSDFVGGRGLAWLGGIAILAGTILFLALAISHGWIGREARVILAAIGSAALVGGGAWLHARRGRTEAAVAMVGAGTAGWFATAAVAGEVYELVPPVLAVASSMIAGAVATTLAIRWAGRAIGALGLVGALLSPVLVGPPTGAATLALLEVAGMCAMWVVVWQRWSWLALATVLISAPQWGSWMLGGSHSAVAEVIVLVAFAALGIAGAVGIQLRANDERLDAAAAAVLVLNACIAGAVGRIALLDVAGEAASALWLVALALAHGAVGLWRYPRVTISRPLRQLSLAVAVILADVAFGLTASGIALIAGWGAAALAFAWLIRRADPDSADATLLTVGVSTHVGLVLMRTVIDASPRDVVGGSPELVQLATVALLATSCLASARITGARHRLLQAGLDVLGLAAIAYLTAGALDGVALIAAWAAEGLALDRIARRTRGKVAQGGAAAFVGSSVVYAVAAEAPPTGLVTGVPSLPAAAIAMALVAGAFLVLSGARAAESRERRWLVAAAASTLLYLASVAIVTVFQPTDGTLDMVLDLSVRQQGQVLLSAMWSVVGLGALLVGLRRGSAPVRGGALALLLLSVGKVFLYDLSTLTSIYRVISFIVLGLLLLTGAFAYQRLRPPPRPDLRTLHPSQR